MPLPSPISPLLVMEVCGNLKADAAPTNYLPVTGFEERHGAEDSIARKEHAE